MRTIATLLVAVTFALAACGGDDGDDAPNGTPSQTFSIIESDFTLTPATVTIDAPGTYTFEATNDGGVDHSLEIEGNGVEEVTETIGPGESASVTVDLETGTYEMYCPIGNHRDLGMSGEVTVG